MYIKCIEFKREENSEWEKGYYISKDKKNKLGTILDINYVPVNQGNKVFPVYDTKNVKLILDEPDIE